MIDNRMLGALAIALAGVLFGFATGRFSAWLVPPSGPASVSSTAKPSVPLQPAAAQKHADSLSKHPLSTSSIADIALDRSKSADSAAAQKPAGSPAEPRQAGAPDDAKLKKGQGRKKGNASTGRHTRSVGAATQASRQGQGRPAIVVGQAERRAVGEVGPLTVVSPRRCPAWRRRTPSGSERSTPERSTDE